MTKSKIYQTAENVARNLITAEILNKKYVSIRGIRLSCSDAFSSDSQLQNIIKKCMKKDDDGKYVNALDLDERTEVIYKLPANQLDALRTYTQEIKTKDGKQAAKQRQERKKYPEGYQKHTKKKIEKTAETEQYTAFSKFGGEK